MSTAGRWAAAAVLMLCCTATPVHAQAVQVVQFLGGAAVGLGLHESGHLLFDAAFDASPGVRKVSAGFLPFFAITHHPVTPLKEFTISSAGFWVQHGTSELLLVQHPDLRHEHAPFAKGLLAFNVLTSVGYASAAFARRGPPERDTRGMALSVDTAEPWMGATILAPALLDGARYYRPHSRALRWASRGAKVAGALLIVKAR